MRQGQCQAVVKIRVGDRDDEVARMPQNSASRINTIQY